MLIQQLRYLVALARERHFARAAATCGVTQPTLSEGIKHLEDELGVPLVDRGQRYQGLTPAGQRVLGWAQRMVADADSLAQDVGEIRDGLVGRLTMGVIPAAHSVVPLLTTPLLETHPGLRLHVLSQTSIEIQRALDDFTIDVGLTYLDNEPLTHVRTQTVYHERYYLATPVDGPFGSHESVAWKDAAQVPLCLLDSSMQNRRILDAIFQQAGVTPRTPVETTSLLTVSAHVALRRWSTVLPHTFLPLIAPLPGVHTVPLVDPVAEHAVGLVVSDREPLPPLARALRSETAELNVDAALDEAARAALTGVRPAR